MKLSTAASLLAFAPALLFAQAPRALPPGELPNDARLQPLKDLDGYFPFAPSPSPDAWKPRAEQVRMQMRVALGLWPEPSRTPLNPVIHGRIDGDDYTVEKVFFESMPGFFVTGSLYRPKAAPAAGKKRPAILCPHGHWEDARFRLLGEAELKKELASGGERLANGGRSIFQSLGVQLARMGCVAFVYDMLGNSDSQQISSAIAHKFARQRPEMSAKENWGLYSPQAELHAQSVMGLQTWNSIRALDFLTSLPDVDPQRLGCTGASGGGTQTMILAALDPRLSVSCPAVMVSTAMQGGCTCENASLLRVDTGNVEFAALFAPKPQGLTAADDWTKEMETKGFPELKKHYAMMGAPEHVALWAMLHFGHNYNAPSREKIYGWFNKHLQLGLNETVLVEREYTVLNRDQLTVWDADHPAPPGGADFERKLLKWWHDDAQQQLAKSAAKFREIALPAWKAIIGRSLADVGEVTWAENKESIHDDGNGGKFKLRTGLLRSPRHTQELPAYILASADHGDRPPRVLWVGESGKNSLFEENATTLRPEVRELLKGSGSILAIDLLYQGEFLSDGMPLTQTKRVKNPREAAAYTFGYNHALFAQRVHDLLSALQFMNAHPGSPVKLVAFGKTAPIAAAARVVAAGSVGAAVIDTNDFDFAAIESAHDVNFLPGTAKYGGLPGLLALGAPARTYVLHKDPDVPASVRAAYANTQKGHLEHAEPSPQSRIAAIKWLNTGPDATRRAE